MKVSPQKESLVLVPGIDGTGRLVIRNSFAHFGSPARLWLGYHLLRATPWGMMRVLEGHGHSCLIAPDLDLSTILDEWAPA